MKNKWFFQNQYLFIFFIYAIALTLFATFSYKLIFHDTWEYISVAKKFAGYLNADIFNVHSLVYPFFLSFFAKIFPSMLTLKLVNISWLFLIGILLYYSESKKTAFLIWIFSPITWASSVMISPFLPTAFFFLVAYLSIQKWLENKKNSYFIISALALGLSAAFSDISMILVIFFIIAFFYDKKSKKVILYSILVLLSFSLRLILDASLFSLAVNGKLIPFPIYSIIRFFGARLVIQLGMHPTIGTSKLNLASFGFWSFLIVISPLLFYLYKANYQKHKKVIFFLALSAGLFLFQGGGYLYFIILTPITILLLSETFRRKELILHIVLSSIIIIFMVYPYFVVDQQEVEKRNLIINDVQMIKKDFSFNTVIFDTETLAMFYIWDKNLPFIISYDEYSRILQNNKYYTYYNFEVRSDKIDMQKILEIKAGLKTNIKKDIDYKNLPWLLEKGENPPEGYNLVKCYDLLCVYQRL